MALYRAKYVLMGRPRTFVRGIRRGPIQRCALSIGAVLSRAKSRMLMLSNEPTPFSLALADSGERVHRLRASPFLKTPTRTACAVERKI